MLRYIKKVQTVGYPLGGKRIASLRELQQRIAGKKAYLSNPVCEIVHEARFDGGPSIAKFTFVDNTVLEVDMSFKKIEEVMATLKDRNEQFEEKEENEEDDEVIIVNTIAEMEAYEDKG
eukprot:tig00000823_g4542.t1